MENNNFKIIISLVISFIIISFYRNYLSTGSFISPIQAQTIKKIFSNIKLPKLNLSSFFTLKTSQIKENQPEKPNNINYSFTLDTAPKTSEVVHDLSEKPEETIFSQNFTPPQQPPTNPPKQPTSLPKPIKPPKPTATPQPTPIISDERPGKTLYEIFEEVSKIACFPKALLKAVQSKESGALIKNSLSPATIKIYNTYGWWKTGAGDPCFGMGYYEQSGIVPPDSIKAGTRCGPVYGNPTDLKIMGIFQISEWEQEVIQKYIRHIIPKNDRRVFFDNALMFAFLSRNRVGNPPKDCNNWPDEAVRKVAEKHSGTCNYYYSINGVSGDYCKEVLELYKKFKKEE